MADGTLRSMEEMEPMIRPALGSHCFVIMGGVQVTMQVVSIRIMSVKELSGSFCSKKKTGICGVVAGCIAMALQP